MALILNIETATDVCSVALSQENEILSVHESMEIRSHASVLTTLISKCLEDSGYKYQNLDAVAVSMGPGSYTGLRIGVSAAKGICYALDLPLIAVPTLKAMSAARLQSTGDNTKMMVPMIDARRMEVYTAAYDHELNEVMPVSAMILKEDSFSDMIQKAGEVILFGDGVTKASEYYKDLPGFIFDHESRASAKGVAMLSHDLFSTGSFADLAYFEPFYLKNFVSSSEYKLLKNK